jgi:hypothetical protein
MERNSKVFVTKYYIADGLEDKDMTLKCNANYLHHLFYVYTCNNHDEKH